jgi:LmbE family N-acetylglucosaminyl deacetylase
MASATPTALFLFAHQDDEFGVFQMIIDHRAKGHRVCCAYLTDGGFNGCSVERRNRESLFVLRQLRVEEQDVSFVGQTLAIPDARLHEHLESAAAWVDGWIGGFADVDLICVPAWEGGHHDHDALHAIGVIVAERRGLLLRVRQFPLYNGYRRPGPLFRVLAPLPMNGEIEEVRIPWRNRLRFLRYCLCYPSQAKTWLGLFPFTAVHYLSGRKQTLQPVSSARLLDRPHGGKLYYERRGFFTWNAMTACLSRWRDAVRRLDS